MNDARHRLGGLSCLAIGAAAFWLAIWMPLQDVQAGAATLAWMPRVAVLVALCLVFWLFLLVTGARHPYRDVERQSLTPVGWVLFAAVAVAALGGFRAMNAALRSLGSA